MPNDELGIWVVVQGNMIGAGHGWCSRVGRQRKFDDLLDRQRELERWRRYRMSLRLLAWWLDGWKCQEMIQRIQEENKVQKKDGELFYSLPVYSYNHILLSFFFITG